MNAKQMINQIYPNNINNNINLPELLNIDLLSFDLKLSLQLAAGKVDVAKNLYKIMINSLPQEKELINLAFKQRSLYQLQEHIHKLYGGCCYTGFIKLKYITKKLDEKISLKNNQTINYEVLQQYIDLINIEIDFLIKQKQRIICTLNAG